MYMDKDMNPRMTGGGRPIGYWLKHLDRLIEATFDRTLADVGLGQAPLADPQHPGRRAGDEHRAEHRP